MISASVTGQAMYSSPPIRLKPEWIEELKVMDEYFVKSLLDFLEDIDCEIRRQLERGTKHFL